MHGKPLKSDWVARVVFLKQILLFSSGWYDRHFWDIWLKIYRLPNFIMLFQLVLTTFFKSEHFLCLPKVVIWNATESNRNETAFQLHVVTLKSIYILVRMYVSERQGRDLRRSAHALNCVSYLAWLQYEPSSVLRSKSLGKTKIHRGLKITRHQYSLLWRVSQSKTEV